MTIWLDAHLSPSLAEFILQNFELESYHVSELGLRDSTDNDIFRAARESNAIVITKDSVLIRRGPPPSIIWLTIGNTSNERMRAVLKEHLARALDLIRGGESIVEITGNQR